MPSEPAPRRHRVFLTFDDGPDAVHTDAILDTLAGHSLGAIFFVLGEQLETSQGLARLERIAREGHAIGNHGYSQQSMLSLNDDEIAQSIHKTERLIGACDQGLKLWRPPFGETDLRVDSLAASLGYRRMLWNADSLDWRDEQATGEWVERLVRRIEVRMRRGFRNSVCLLHDTRSTTAIHLVNLLAQLERMPAITLARYDAVEKSEPVSIPFDGMLVVALSKVNALYVLNESASLIWESFVDSHSEARAAEKLELTYGISGETAQRDVTLALRDWWARGLLGLEPLDAEDPGPWPRTIEEASNVYRGRFEDECSYRLVDASFCIHYASVALADAIHPRFANLAVCEKVDDKNLFEIYETGDGLVLRTPDGLATSHPSAAALSYELFFEIVRLTHSYLQPMAVLHSSLLDSANGAIALVAHNGGGKSTLAAALGKSGLRNLGDDRIFLDFVTAQPAAVPNSVSLKQGSWPLLASRYPEILQLPVCRNDRGDEIRFILPKPPAERLLPQIKHIFFPRYAPNQGTSSLALTPVQALERIAVAESWISSEPGKLSAFLRWLEHTPCYDLPFSDLEAGVAEVLKRLPA